MSACGDGTIKVWDVQAPPQANPLRSFEEHKREVTKQESNILSSSQEGLVSHGYSSNCHESGSFLSVSVTEYK